MTEAHFETLADSIHYTHTGLMWPFLLLFFVFLRCPRERNRQAGRQTDKHTLYVNVLSP